MNFLAHIYLSGTNEFVTLGNFMADGIKGKQYLNYTDDVQTGILLHRAIDTYTDSHPIVRQSTKRLHKHYSHYSGVIVDLFYDHFLAKNWSMYSDVSLPKFINTFYTSLQNNYDILPEYYQDFTTKMIAGNWLLSYASIEGMQRVLNGMNHRTKGRSKMNEATKELQEYYEDFQSEFIAFFEELQNFSNIERQKLELKFKL